MSDAVAQATRSRIASQTLWAVGLLLAFAALVFWFNVVDFYDRHFFSHGLVVAADNLARIGFIFLLSWLVGHPAMRTSATAEKTA